MRNFDEEKLLISRCEDTIKLCEKHYSLKFLGFLTPYERAVIERSVLPPVDIVCAFYGGYDYAERTIFTAVPEPLSYNIDCELPIDVIEITGRDISLLSHRDYLGSILGLGIKREKIGDIAILDDCCFIFVLNDISEYILNNLSKIGRVGVNLKKKELFDIKIPEPRIKEIKGTVSSMRLDCVLSLALSVSRSTANSLISSDKVFVNWKEENRNDFTLNDNDMLSVRGFGRFKIKASNDFSRKNRQHIIIEKYL